MSARHGGDHRGSSYDRRARKEWILKFWGDGERCLCVHCRCVLEREEVEADRIIPGGPYARWNIQPSCSPCNKARGDNPDWHPTGVGVGVQS